MVNSPTSPQMPPGDIGRNDAHGDDTPNDHVHRGGSSHTDIPDSDSSTRKAADHRITQVEKPACSTFSNMRTSDSTVDRSWRPFLLGLPGEIILEILRAFPPDPRLPTFNIQPAGPKSIALFRSTTRLAITALSRTCRALRHPSQKQLFSDIYLTKGKQMGLLLRSFIEKPRFCTYVRGLCLGFALNREREAYDGVHTIYEKIDLNKIPTFLLGALEHCGVKEQQTGAFTEDDVEESFEIFAGLMLSLTTRLEHLTIGFDDRDRTHPVDERRADLYSPPRINRESPSGIDRFISAFHSTYGGNDAGNDAGSPDRTENFKHKVLTRLQRLEIHGNVYRFFEWPPSLTRFSRFPVPGLLALPTLTSFTSYSDSSQWASLSETGRAAPLALQELSLYQETKTGSALCSLLERCPDLKKLEIVMDCPNPRDGISYGTETARISTAITTSCPQLGTLILRTKGNHLLFFEDEPGRSWLSKMHNLVNLQADVPCLFKSLEDMALADVSGRLPPNIENLTIYDMWYRDPRFLYCMRYEVRAPDDYVLHPQDNTDAVAEPFAEMLLRLRSSLLADRLPNLRKVAVKSPIFEFDVGNASSDLTKAFEAAEVDFKVIPYGFHLPYEEGISFSERGRSKIC
ncbi:hypothetical protein GCG54_00004299 [Colletotrichum gloeosporioides]|uniref:Uncharacterized protein n=1 Tax=Colletotrichum gloeosporioides TaxID=474922 RepID=A0A8H4CMK9_COLGL|nr:uncharacterized protein GCG54_00004299 [Colletotrichum gloeosporioides]KAF3806666.1 hypothetical protein GCG54_00004299 [Colletotrichum gloeosporioides]